MQALGGLDPRPFELLPLNDAPNPLSGGNCALCQVVAPGAAHDIGDHKACESAEDPGSHAVEHWISAPVTEHGNSATRPMEYIAALGTRWPMTLKSTALKNGGDGAGLSDQQPAVGPEHPLGYVALAESTPP